MAGLLQVRHHPDSSRKASAATGAGSVVPQGIETAKIPVEDNGSLRRIVAHLIREESESDFDYPVRCHIRMLAQAEFESAGGFATDSQRLEALNR